MSEAAITGSLICGRGSIKSGSAPQTSPDAAALRLRLLIAGQKLPNALHDTFFRVNTIEKLGPIQRVASEKALIQDLSASKGTTGNIPGQAEELDTLTGAGRVSGQI